MSPSKPSDRKRARGDGAVYQACDARRGCPPMKTITRPDGTTKKTRPTHDCQGMWVARLDLGTGPDGKPHRPKREATTKNKALIKLQELKAQVAKHGDVPKRSLTVEQWLTQWLTEIHKPRVGPGTYRNDKSRINVHLVPGIGKHRMDKLQPRHLREMYTHMRDTGKTGMRPGVHRTLHKALNDALRESIVVRNVASLVEPPGGLGTKRGALTPAQGRTLLRYTHREKDGKLVDRLASRWGMALLTAARQGECLGLEWPRVDLEDRVMDVAWQLRRLLFVHGCGPEPDDDDGPWPCGKRRAGYCPDRHFDLPEEYEYRQLVGGQCLVRPKSLKRLLPIPAPLYADLKAHKESDTTPNAHNLVWHEPNGAPISDDVDRRRWATNIRAAGLPRVVLHEARHTTITLLMEAGVDPEVIKAIAGHSSLAVQEAYKHVDIRHTAEALGKVAGTLYLKEIEA